MTSPDNKKDDLWGRWASESQKGNKESYRDLLKDIAPFIKAYLLPTLANPEWADDITQEVLLSVHKSLKTYNSKYAFKPWLISIINFRRTDFLRKHYARRDDKKTSLINPEFLRTYVTKSPFAGEYKDIEAALSTLPKKQRKVFEMMKIQGHSAEEVAKEMNMSVSAVKVSAHRAMKKLRGQLG